MKDLKRRIPTFSLSVAGVVALLALAYNPWFQYGVVLAVAALAATAIWEYEQFAKAKGGQMIFPALLAITIIESVAFYAAAKASYLHSLPFVVFFIGFLILFALHFRQKDGAVVDLAVSSFGLLYIAVPMGMVLGVLYFPFLGSFQDGRWWVSYLLVVTKITDVGAYFAGNLWGRRKLAPSISPGKTVEGAIFGLACAVAASYGFHALSTSLGASFHLGAAESIWLGLILGFTGQFGDLSESLLKRDANKKDSNALPGLGGVLDSVDSLLFNVPIIYLYLTYIR
jgi:phosphatidate cytidylyltransferase